MAGACRCRRFFVAVTYATAVILFLIPGRGGGQAAIAAPPGSPYGDIVLRVRVVDREGRPASGIRLAFHVDRDGQTLADSGETYPIQDRINGEAATDAAGIAAFHVAGNVKQGFRGKVKAEVTPAGSAEVSFLDPLPLHLHSAVPSDNDFSVPPTLHIFERPDRFVDGFPLWTAQSGHPDRIVVILEGFDLYNRVSATDNLRLIKTAADALRRQGISLLVVNYPDSHMRPDLLAPLAARAIHAAARISGHDVAVAGLSMGGIVGRWALCEAEAAGKPLPVHTFLMLDSPNRGAVLHPALQAITLHYGLRSDEDALHSDAARSLLYSVPKDVKWKRIGLGPGVDSQVPETWASDSAPHDRFFTRLRALNDRNGYPKSCRIVAVANSSRQSPANRSELLHLWLPYGYSWTLPARPEDHASGSLLPPFYCERFRITRPFGLAGAYLRSAPTFVPCASALDAGPNEKPRFNAWYAIPNGATPRAHDAVEPGAAAFTVRILVNAPWARRSSQAPREKLNVDSLPHR